MASTTTRPGQVVAATTTSPAQADPGDGASAVADSKVVLPYPDDVLECVAARADGDPRLVRALAGKGDDAAGVAQAAAAACVVEVRSGPRFAEDLQRASGGKLSGEQVACAAREYGELSAEQVEAVAGAVMNPQKADPEALAPVREIYETCGIKAVGG